MKKLAIALAVALLPVAAESATYTDNFNRTSENPLANGTWTTVTGLAGMRTVSNTIAASSTDDSNYNASYWSANSFTDDQFAEATIKSANRYAGVAVRVSSSANTYYYLRHVATTEVCQLFKIVSGTPTQLGSDYGTCVNGTVIRLEVAGTTLTPYFNGTPQATRTDSAISSGSAGIWALNSGGNGVIDDWSGGDLAAPVATPTFDYGTGTYKNEVTVTISDATSGATICYTVDGSTPGAATPGTCDGGSTLTYSAPVLIEDTGTVLKAIGTKAAMTNSSAASATYTLRDIATFYLATAADGGSDANNGTSSGSPWLTPNHALLCGDTIQAKASTSYVAGNFGSNDWGTVQCIDEENVAWLTCETFAGCKISASSAFGMRIDKSYWGVQGWEVAESGDNGLCFGVIPGGASTIHHIVLANNICNGGANGFASSPTSTTVGVDYLAILSNIVWNAAQSTILCNSGVTVYEPIKSDSAAGTHIYIAGNFSFDNSSPTNCLGGSATYDGNGIVLDDVGNEQQSGTAYDQQIAVENNIAVFNGGYGFANTGNSTPDAPIFYRYNTSYGNLTASNTSTTTCGDFTLLVSSQTTASLNLIHATTEHACSGGTQDRYAFAVNEADATDTVANNWLYSAFGQNTAAISSSGFSYGSNTTGTSPNFANPVDPGQPNCSGKTSVTNCMATVLRNYMPRANGALAYGYQFGQQMSASAYWPTWLNGVTLPSSVTTLGTGVLATGAVQPLLVQ